MKYLLLLMSINCLADCHDKYDNTEDRLTCIRMKRQALTNAYQQNDNNMMTGFYLRQAQDVTKAYEDSYNKQSDIYKDSLNSYRLKQYGR